LLTGNHVDPATHTPAFKETAVKMEILPERGEDPLRRLNFRFSGKRTPQMGVEVNKKWKRADYHFPGEPAYHFPGKPALVQIQPAAPAGSK